MKTINTEKTLILSFFQQHTTLSLSEIIEQYKNQSESPLSRISIIRRLNSLVEKGQLQKIGKGRGVKYEKTKISSLLESINTTQYFNTPSHKRTITKSFSFEVFNTFTTTLFLPKEQQLLEELHQKFQTKFQRFTTPVSLKKEFERIVIEFSWKSSSIEGNTYSLLETERLIKENTPTAGKTNEETQMILNHKESFQFIQENKGYFQNISLLKIESLHSLLVQHLGISKNIRTTPVGITGTEYKPLDNQFQIKEAMEKTIDLINQKTNFFEKALLSLLLIAYIQPFEDGNKRTSRTLTNAFLFSFGTCPISFRTVDEIEYKKAVILFYEQNNITMLKKIFLEQFEYSVETYF